MQLGIKLIMLYTNLKTDCLNYSTLANGTTGVKLAPHMTNFAGLTYFIIRVHR